MALGEPSGRFDRLLSDSYLAKLAGARRRAKLTTPDSANLRLRGDELVEALDHRFERFPRGIGDGTQCRSLATGAIKGVAGHVRGGNQILGYTDLVA